MYNKIVSACFHLILDRDQLLSGVKDKSEQRRQIKPDCGLPSTQIIMKPKTILQEMLLFTDTSFAKKELCERHDKGAHEANCSVGDQLEKACWSGLLFDMFPEMFEHGHRKTMCVWRVSQAEQFIHVELGSSATSPQVETSIDPYFFLPLVVYHN
jgi:hypothetical protein